MRPPPRRGHARGPSGGAGRSRGALGSITRRREEIPLTKGNQRKQGKDPRRPIAARRNLCSSRAAAARWTRSPGAGAPTCAHGPRPRQRREHPRRGTTTRSRQRRGRRSGGSPRRQRLLPPRPRPRPLVAFRAMPSATRRSAPPRGCSPTLARACRRRRGPPRRGPAAVPPPPPPPRPTCGGWTSTTRALRRWRSTFRPSGTSAARRWTMGRRHGSHRRHRKRFRRAPRRGRRSARARGTR